MKLDSLYEMIKRHEGFVGKVYQCPAGRWTIGYGRNIQDLGITEAEADLLLGNDILRVIMEARRFSWFDDLNENQRIAIISMIFQMGISAFSKFKKTIEFLEKGQFSNAASEAMSSAWAKQTPARAREITELLKG